jgi:hypothetical protein
MFSLNKTGIPCVATTSYDDGEVVRKAFVVGRVKDVWFKSERSVVLKQKISNLLLEKSIE